MIPLISPFIIVPLFSLLYKTHYSRLTLLIQSVFYDYKKLKIITRDFYLIFEISYLLLFIHAIKVACISLFSFLADFNTSIPAVKIGLFYDSYIKAHSF